MLNRNQVLYEVFFDILNILLVIKKIPDDFFARSTIEIKLNVNLNFTNNNFNFNINKKDNCIYL